MLQRLHENIKHHGFPTEVYSVSQRVAINANVHTIRDRGVLVPIPQDFFLSAVYNQGTVLPQRLQSEVVSRTATIGIRMTGIQLYNVSSFWNPLRCLSLFLPSQNVDNLNLSRCVAPSINVGEKMFMVSTLPDSLLSLSRCPLHGRREELGICTTVPLER